MQTHPSHDPQAYAPKEPAVEWTKARGTVAEFQALMAALGNGFGGCQCSVYCPGIYSMGHHANVCPLHEFLFESRAYVTEDGTHRATYRATTLLGMRRYRPVLWEQEFGDDMDEQGADVSVEWMYSLGEPARQAKLDIQAASNAALERAKALLENFPGLAKWRQAPERDDTDDDNPEELPW